MTFENISFRFTKSNRLENKLNKNGDLILWDYTNTVIYIREQKILLSSE